MCVIKSGVDAIKAGIDHSFEFLVCLYGIAVFFCLIGYIYALFDWYKQSRAKVSRKKYDANWPVISPSNEPKLDDIVATVDTMQQERVTSPVTDQPNLNQSKMHNKIDAPPEMQITSHTDDYLNMASETKKSWNQRRSERRQRYKELKARSRSVAASRKGNSLMTAEEETFSNTLSKTIKLNTNAMKDYYCALTEQKTHENSFHRPSVQITDLDDIHIPPLIRAGLRA
ncbi:unnamed protein product [Calicophoron daubneyi]|uniref:Uncharacterized protein n=1 Tax=Calicophoron daubneyi TaxID=300641 RepID=A0AAV2TFH1_CALDB